MPFLKVENLIVPITVVTGLGLLAYYIKERRNTTPANDVHTSDPNSSAEPTSSGHTLQVRSERQDSHPVTSPPASLSISVTFDQLVQESFSTLKMNGQELQALRVRLDLPDTDENKDLPGILKQQVLHPDCILKVVEAIKKSLSPEGEEVNSSLRTLETEIKYFQFKADGLVLFDEDSRDLAIEFKKHMERDFDDMRVLMFDEYNLEKTQLGGMDDTFNVFRFVFIFVTENLTRDLLMRFMGEMCLVQSLLEESKKHRFIPIWTKQQKPNIPELRPFIGIKYHYYLKDNTDQTYRSSVRRLLHEGRNLIRRTVLSEDTSLPEVTEAPKVVINGLQAL